MLKALLLGSVLLTLPIWRQGVKRDLNFAEYMAWANQTGYEPFGSPHIPYNEAVSRAHEVFCGCHGITRRAE